MGSCGGEAVVEIVVAAHVLARSLEQTWLTREEYERLPRVTVADDSGVNVREALNDAVAKTVGPEQLREGCWTAAVTHESDGRVCLTPRQPGHTYGVRQDGRIVMPYGYFEISVADFVRAIDDGYYENDGHTVVVFHGPPLGGNGAVAQTLVPRQATLGR
jgi:hypothetical protein